MKKSVLSQLGWVFLWAVISVAGQSCPGPQVEKYFEPLTWGGWQLQSISNPSGGSPVVGDQYLERNYTGFVISGPGSTQTTELDSVLLFRDRQLVFAGQVAERLITDAKQQKIVYRLTNNKFYWIQFVPIEGSEDGTGNDQLLVSDFVDSRQALDKATVYRYVRTNKGKRPW